MRLTATRLGLTARGASLRDQILGGASIATLAYIAAVEAADGQQLDASVLAPMVTFANWRIPLGGVCCLMAGARTLAGALVPLVGPAPTAVNFVSGDYNRLRLKANGTTKYLNTNRRSDEQLQNDEHLCIWVAVAPTADAERAFIGPGIVTGGSSMHSVIASSALQFRSRTSTIAAVNNEGVTTGFKGVSRNNSANFVGRTSGASVTYTQASSLPGTEQVAVFARNAAAPNTYSDAGLSMYSRGSDIDLEGFDSRVTAAIADITLALS